MKLLNQIVLVGGIFLSADFTHAEVPSKNLTESQTVLKFTIQRYVIRGANLISAKDFDLILAPFVGKDKNFADVQHALEAVEKLYVERGFSAIHVSLPEQELEAGIVRFQVIESHFGKVVIKDNQYNSKENVLNAIPSVRPNGVPHSKLIAHELRLANENPSRQMSVVLKEGEVEGTVDASVLVTDKKPDAWGVSLDNSGSKETGRSRLGLSYRNANVFNSDRVAQMQVQISPQYLDRVKVIGGSYKVPLYASGNSMEFFGGYSNINSLVGGLSNFQGGGELFSSRYNILLNRNGAFDPSLSLGVDWRRFNKIELTNPPPTTIYNVIVVTPLSIAYSALGRVGKGEVNFNGSYSINIPSMSQGKSKDFADYDLVNHSNPTPRYKLVRYNAGYLNTLNSNWQFRTALNGQWSGDTLIQGEQIRLGGADAVRGFSEGSETGEIGVRLNLEIYTPRIDYGTSQMRGLFFGDGGLVKVKAGTTTTITSAGFGVRSTYTERVSFRLDLARIMKAGNDPQQVKGDWRMHSTLSATF